MPPRGSSSRGSSWPRDPTGISCASCIGKWILHHLRHLGSPPFKKGRFNERPEIWAGLASEEWMKTPGVCKGQMEEKSLLLRKWDERRRKLVVRSGHLGARRPHQGSETVARALENHWRIVCSGVTNNWIYIFKRLLWLHVKCGLECS